LNVTGLILGANTLFQSGRGAFIIAHSGRPHVREALAVTCLLMIAQAVRVGARFVGLWLFVHEDRRTPAFWTVFFAAVIPLDLVAGLLGGAVSSLYTGGAFAAAATRGVGREWWAVAFSIAWGLYWWRSRRVRNTYGYTGWRWPPPTGEPEYWPA